MNFWAEQVRHFITPRAARRAPPPRGVVFASEHRNVANDMNVYAGQAFIENVIW